MFNRSSQQSIFYDFLTKESCRMYFNFPLCYSAGSPSLDHQASSAGSYFRALQRTGSKEFIFMTYCCSSPLSIPSNVRQKSHKQASHPITTAFYVMERQSLQRTYLNTEPNSAWTYGHITIWAVILTEFACI